METRAHSVAQLSERPSYILKRFRIGQFGSFTMEHASRAESYRREQAPWNQDSKRDCVAVKTKLCNGGDTKHAFFDPMSESGIYLLVAAGTTKAMPLNAIVCSELY